MRQHWSSTPAEREMTTDAVCESGIPHGCMQGKSIWVSPHIMCLGDVSEGAQKLTSGTREWWVKVRKGLGLTC